MDRGRPDAWAVLLTDPVDHWFFTWHTQQVILLCVTAAILCILVLIARAQRRSSDRKGLANLDAKTYWTAGDGGEANSSLQIERQDVSTSATSPLGSAPLRPTGPRLVAGRKPSNSRTSRTSEIFDESARIQPLIFFFSLTGTTERLAPALEAKFEDLQLRDRRVLAPQVHDLSYIDLDDFFLSGPKATASAAHFRYFYCLLIPSYDIDTLLNTFLAHLDETHNDFRIDTAPLSTLLGYSVFGLGDKQGWPSEESGFCSQAIEVDKWMAKLTGGKRAYPLGIGDVKSNVNDDLQKWAGGVVAALADLSTHGQLGRGVPGSGDAVESGDEAEEEPELPEPSRRKRHRNSQLADLEDVGGVKSVLSTSRSSPLAIDFTTYSTPATEASLKAMVPSTSPTYSALTKQGYTIVGSHSGVKICRWTKSALRGRGSCYKNSFYGIKSHLCMETTPSLSCSNKCVFCWRHGTNPVSTTWRWQVDDPVMIFRGVKDGHYKKIKMMRGVPGVRAERFEEAMRIRHCALSLVGEPIFYPRINEFVDLLHRERISSFLVCNAQHPDQLERLKRVTQLYVSIDASNRESLRRIDRPLHRDFWERFQKCLEILREKRFVQRTVFRLTLVKGFNVEDEVDGYADLVQKGLPCFIEIKGVTYCGTSSSAGAGLTMQNVPFYEEVVTFVEALDAALASRGLQYGIAAEHAHSCCVLLASKRFLLDGRWNTLINYDRFFQLLEAGEDFGPEDYCSPTPEWALWGNGGFDPADERVDRKGKPKAKAQKCTAEVSGSEMATVRVDGATIAF